MTNKKLKPVVNAMGAAFIASGAASMASADAQNPFEAKDLRAGYDLANYGQHGEKGGKDGEGKCGEGKCGEGKADKEGKCGEGKCGGDKKAAAEGETPAVSEAEAGGRN
jgi:uncharacterized low-complexity protein